LTDRQTAEKLLFGGFFHPGKEALLGKGIFGEHAGLEVFQN
jgi:hypothetical protein